MRIPCMTISIYNLSTTVELCIQHTAITKQSQISTMASQKYKYSYRRFITEVCLMVNATDTIRRRI